MRFISRTLLALSCCCLAGLYGGTSASAEGFVPTISLKSGESIDLMNVFFVVNCRSVLKATPQVEILDGPPQVSAAVREGMVLPRIANCAKPVKGGTIVLTAGE